MGIKQYNRNEQYFDQIDSPQKAYVLGFLLADGGVAENSRSIVFELKETDREAVEYIKNQLEYNGPIYNIVKDEKQYAELCVCSDALLNALAAWDFIPRKTYHVNTTFHKIPYLSHAIRGLFDGDGSLYIKTSDQSYNFMIIGHCSVMEQVRLILKQELNIDANIYYEKKQNFLSRLVVYSSTGYKAKTNDLYRLLKWLYKDADFALSRKKVKAEQFFALADSCTMYGTKWTKEEIQTLTSLYFQGTPTNQIAAQLNKSEASIKRQVAALRITRPTPIRHTTINRWNTEELNKLQQFYSTTSVPDLSKLLNRSENSITRKASDLQLKKH